MNKIILSYLIKTFLMYFCFFYYYLLFWFNFKSFEEIEFFKNINVSALLPLKLTAVYKIPSMIIKIFPFIIFFQVCDCNQR